MFAYERIRIRMYVNTLGHIHAIYERIHVFIHTFAPTGSTRNTASNKSVYPWLISPRRLQPTFVRVLLMSKRYPCAYSQCMYVYVYRQRERFRCKRDICMSPADYCRYSWGCCSGSREQEMCMCVLTRMRVCLCVCMYASIYVLYI